MHYKKHLLILALTAVIGWGSFALVLFKLEPCTAPGEITMCYSVSALDLSLFFISAFFALTASFSLLGFFLRVWFHRSEISIDNLQVAFRQAILLTFASLGSLGLLLLHALTWWSGLLIIAIILLIEFYFTPTA